MKSCTPLLLILLLLALSATAQTRPSHRQVKNITAFCRLYGYIRYFHPSDETQQIDWERFAMYGSRHVLDAPDDKQLLTRLKELFHPLAPTAQLFLDSNPGQFRRDALTPPKPAGYKETSLKPSGYKEISWQYTGMSMRFIKYYPRPEHSTVRLNRSAWQLTPHHYDTAGQGYAYRYLPAAYNGGHFALEANIRVDQGAAELGLININDNKQGSTYSTPPTMTKDGAWKKYQLSGTIDEKCTQLFLYIGLRKKGRLLANNVRFTITKDGQTYDIPLKEDSWEHSPNNNYTFRLNKDELQLASIDSLALSRVPDSPIYDYRTTVGEYVRKPLVPGISCIVPLALYGDSAHTYPMTPPAALQKLITTVMQHTPAEPTADSLDVRLGDIVIAWNIYRHFFPFWSEASQTSDDILHDAITRALQDRTDVHFFHTLQLMTAPLNDEHIFPSFNLDSTKYGMAGINFAVAEGKLLVRDVLLKDLRDKVKPGDIVDSLDGRTGMEALAEKEKYISGAPQGRRQMAISKLPFGYPFSAMQLTLHRGTDTTRITIQKTGWMDWHTIIDTLPANGAEVAGKVYYINLLESAEKVESAISHLQDAKAVIFDIRGYPSFDLFEMVMSHLITENVTSQPVLYDPQIIYPDYEKVKFISSYASVTPKAPHWTCKAYFLSNASIGSHPEYFLALIKTYKLGTIIGQPTAGVDGTINGFNLPGGYELTFTGIKVAPLPGTSSHLQGVPPDIFVEPTAASITAGKDYILEQAIKIAKEGVPLNELPSVKATMYPNMNAKIPANAL